MQAFIDLAPDVHWDMVQILAWNRHGSVDGGVVLGTFPDGGPFEGRWIRVVLTDGDRITHFEVFDAVDAERARARFAALCAQAGREARATAS